MNTNTLTNYTFPPLTLLEQPKTSDNIENKEALMSIGKEILESLKGFGIVALLLKITHNLIMTRYEIKIVNGKLSEVLELKDDIAMRTGSLDIYITVSQNSYGTVNIDIPNATFSPVNLIELLSSDEFRNNNYGIPVCIGMDASGSVIRDIETMSSLLIFGTTGSGKSICIHSIIMSILYNSTPDVIRFIMVDPEPSELVVYKDIPHMLLPVLTEPIKAEGGLSWTVNEMMRRYDLFNNIGVKNIESYNKKITDDKLPNLIFIIEELSDLFSVYDEINPHIIKLLKYGKNVGIHLIIASSECAILEKYVQLNITSKIAFLLSSQSDSKKFLNISGAESLFGNGDMLFFDSTAQNISHIQGTFISDTEIENTTQFFKNHLYEKQNDSHCEYTPLIKSETIIFDSAENDTTNPNNTEPQSNISIDSLLAELNDLVGLQSVKQEVSTLINSIKIRKIRQEKGLKVPDVSNHLVFCGNPGTGKTTVARLLSKIYRELDILSQGHLIEVDRSDLVAGYVGQTAIKTREVIEKAKGGILFIDEAYSLASDSDNDFGGEAVDILLKNMEDCRADLIVIAAGYTDEMEKFLSMNPGFRSRFNKFIDFADYSAEELYLIFVKMCNKYDYSLSNNALEYVKTFFSDTINSKPINFSNGRFVRNYFEKVIENQSNRIAMADNYDNLQEIIIDDLKI